MKVKILQPMGAHMTNEIVDAAVSPDKNWATAYDVNGQAWGYYGNNFSIIQEEPKESTQKSMNFSEFFGGQQLQRIEFK